jgi:hypothetical protein
MNYYSKSAPTLLGPAALLKANSIQEFAELVPQRLLDRMKVTELNTLTRTRNALPHMQLLA